MNPRVFGERVRCYRLRRAWEQADLAARIKKSVPTVSRIEHGTLKLTMELMQAVAHAFDMTLIDLLRDDEDAEGARARLVELVSHMREVVATLVVGSRTAAELCAALTMLLSDAGEIPRVRDHHALCQAYSPSDAEPAILANRFPVRGYSMPPFASASSAVYATALYPRSSWPMPRLCALHICVLYP